MINTRRFTVNGNITSIINNGNTSTEDFLSNIEVQLWQNAPPENILLGKGLTDEDGNFDIEFKEDSPTPHIVDGKINNVFMRAFFNGQELFLKNLLTGIVAYWKLDETSGTSAADATGNGHTGTLSGDTIPTWTTGIINNGLEINGGVDGSVDSYLSVPSNTDFDFGTGDFTLAFWMNPNNTSGYYTIFDSGYPTKDSFVLEFLAPDVINFYSGTTVVYSKTYTITTTTWYYIVVRRIGNAIELFINGDSLGNAAFSGNVSCPAPNLLIGKYSGGEALDGVLDEIGIWRGRGLTNEQITLLYNAGAGLQYPF